MKTPEQYFAEDVRLPETGDAGHALSEAEEAFLEKYLGADRAAVLSRIRRVDPRGADVLAGPPAGGAEPDAEAHSDARIRSLAEIRLVGFSVMGREYALPITAIQEIIRYLKPTRLPAAAPGIAGIVNLRGRVTPLVDMRFLLGLPGGGEERFIVVCRHRGLQMGLMINALSTMYKAKGTDIEWNAEDGAGINGCLSLGLYKYGEKLISILSIDNLVRTVLLGGKATHG